MQLIYDYCSDSTQLAYQSHDSELLGLPDSNTVPVQPILRRQSLRRVRNIIY